MRVHVSLPFLVAAIIIIGLYRLYTMSSDVSSSQGYTAGRMTSASWNNIGKKKGE